MIRSLHIDIEGGWGGSSRSLFELVSRLDREKCSPLIVHRLMGPIVTEYEAAGIPTIHVPEIGSYVPRPNRGGLILLQKAPELLKLPIAARKIAKIACECEVNLLHLNYEGLFLLGRRLKKELSLPQITHIRASGLGNDIWSRWMVRSICRTSEYACFISSNEEQWFRNVAREHELTGSILQNIARPAQPRQVFDEPPEAVYLGNLDPIKGVDRLLDVASALDDFGAPPLKIVVYGAARGKRGYKEFLATQIVERQLRSRIELRGFTTNVAGILSKAFVTLRLSRQSDPWGRDVIESIAAGTPCLATGKFSEIVENGITGYLFEPFDPRAVAKQLIDLLQNKGLWQRLSANCLSRGTEQFSGKIQAQKFLEISSELLS
jgi:glycosyltransferase involved in cell wall biosynthesis